MSKDAQWRPPVRRLRTNACPPEICAAGRPWVKSCRETPPPEAASYAYFTAAVHCSCSQWWFLSSTVRYGRMLVFSGYRCLFLIHEQKNRQEWSSAAWYFSRADIGRASARWEWGIACYVGCRRRYEKAGRKRRSKCFFFLHKFMRIKSELMESEIMELQRDNKITGSMITGGLRRMADHCNESVTEPKYVRRDGQRFYDFFRSRFQINGFPTPATPTRGFAADSLVFLRGTSRERLGTRCPYSIQ